MLERDSSSVLESLLSVLEKNALSVLEKDELKFECASVGASIGTIECARVDFVKRRLV